MEELFSVENRVAVVTGGSRGIGLMIARGLVERGARVYISSRNPEACAEAAAELSEVGTCVALPADLSTEAACNQLAAAIIAREPALHILVNNAGATWGAPIADYPDVAWDKVLAINVKSIFHLTRALLPALRAAGGQASVINIGSVDGLRVPPYEAYAYSASKAAVHHLTRHLAARLASEGIRVNAIAPGLFPSKMTRYLLDTMEQEILDRTPLRRLGEPDDVVGAAVYLASRASAFVTGAVLPVDGGVTTAW